MNTKTMEYSIMQFLPKINIIYIDIIPYTNHLLYARVKCITQYVLQDNY